MNYVTNSPHVTTPTSRWWRATRSYWIKGSSSDHQEDICYWRKVCTWGYLLVWGLLRIFMWNVGTWNIMNSYNYLVKLKTKRWSWTTAWMTWKLSQIEIIRILCFPSGLHNESFWWSRHFTVLYWDIRLVIHVWLIEISLVELKVVEL